MNDFDFINKNNLSLEEFIDSFKNFCYYIDYKYDDKDIEKLKDLYAYNVLDFKKMQKQIINEFIQEVM